MEAIYKHKTLNEVNQSFKVDWRDKNNSEKLLKRKKRVNHYGCWRSCTLIGFSLNGYSKETNPLLKQEKDVINFQICILVEQLNQFPCMFSIFDRADYDYKKEIN